MSQTRYTKNGLLIPKDWVDDLGDDVKIKKGKDFVIIESKQRQQARKALTKLVSKLRSSAKEQGQLSENEINELVEDVRKLRASNN